MNKKTLISELIQKVFEKAKNESNEYTAYGLSKFLNQSKDVSISERNLTRFYNGYIDGREDEKITPDRGSLNEMSKYLGFGSFEEYCIDHQNNIDELKSRLRIEKAKSLVIIRALIVICFFLIFALIYLVYNNLEKNCMRWVYDHYEKVKCTGEIGEATLNETLFKYQKQIIPCDTTVFFKNGKPQIWYNKSNNVYSFFTYPGEHPVNGKDLDVISNYIIDNQLKPLLSCDSIKLMPD